MFKCDSERKEKEKKKQIRGGKREKKKIKNLSSRPYNEDTGVITQRGCGG